MHATFQAIWCFTHITSFNPHNKHMSKVSGSPFRDEKAQVPGGTHTPHYIGAARRKPSYLDSESQSFTLYSIEPPKIKSQNYLYLV